MVRRPTDSEEERERDPEVREARLGGEGDEACLHEDGLSVREFGHGAEHAAVGYMLVFRGVIRDDEIASDKNEVLHPDGEIIAVRGCMSWNIMWDARTLTRFSRT